MGRSCIIVTLDCGKIIMLDCGLHMTFNDERRFPEFTKLHLKPDIVLISHFHLDHCGALPFYTEFHCRKVGWTNQIILASPPTKALLPLMLEDFRRVQPETGLT